VRFDGNDAKLIEVAKKNALALGAGHTFVVFLDGGFPVSVLNTIKAVPEVCRVHCATANPTAVVLGTLGTDRKVGRGQAGAAAGVSQGWGAGG
jgi:adenosine/AMP kinase